MKKLSIKIFPKVTTSNILLTTLLVCFICFLFFNKDYGLSFDEVLFYQYGDIIFNVLAKIWCGLPFDHLFDFYNLKYYGTAYLMIGSTFINLIKLVFPTLDVYETWHALNFILFLLGVWLIFILCKRFISEKLSLFAALIFLTQPLLWGHGIMNPKDIPFMVSFLAAVTCGIIAVEKISTQLNLAKTDKPKIFFPGKRQKFLFFFSAIFASLLALEVFFAHKIFRPVIEFCLTLIQSSTPGSLFSPVREKLIVGLISGIPFSSYVDKFLQWLNFGELSLITILFLALLIYSLKRLPSRYGWIILAGVCVGLSSATRILGPAAGALILLYAFIKLRKKSIKFLILYIITAILVMLIFWPYLWNDPINRFIESVKVMVNFPYFSSVLFNGQDYLTTELTWYYLPTLISIQFTLPLIFLAFWGIILVLKKLVVNKGNFLNGWVLLLWFLLPLVLCMVFRPIIYDNFRQFLFIMPPLFIFAAIGLECILSFLDSRRLKYVLSVILLVPGITAGIWLHPYEYVYYNGLVGWTGNIMDKYDNDYWGTALCEAGKYLLENAPAGSQVAFTNSTLAEMFDNCAKGKFHLVSERADVSQITPDYSVLLTRYRDDIDYFRSMEVIKTISRGNTTFVVIKKR